MLIAICICIFVFAAGIASLFGALELTNTCYFLNDNFDNDCSDDDDCCDGETKCSTRTDTCLYIDNQNCKNNSECYSNNCVDGTCKKNDSGGSGYGGGDDETEFM